MNKLLRLDWDVVAGIAAAVLAIILHLLHIVEANVVFTVVLVLLSLLLFRDLRREGYDARLGELLAETRNAVEEVRQSVRPSDAMLIGPRHLRVESRRFSETARGDMLWFNVCFLMFQRQEVFDLMLRPAIENALVDSITFVADVSEKGNWEAHILPKISECAGRNKVREPRWTVLPKTISFVLADVDEHGSTEALLSFWGEPFMAQTVDQQVPRYIFRVRSHSDLIARLAELERQQRMTAGAT